MCVQGPSRTPLHSAVRTMLYTTGSMQCSTEVQHTSRYKQDFAQSYSTLQYNVSTNIYLTTGLHPAKHTRYTDCTPHHCTSLIFPFSSIRVRLASEKGRTKVGLGRESGRKSCRLRLADRDMVTVRAFALPGDTTDETFIEDATTPLPTPPEGTDSLTASVALVCCW